MQNFTEIFILSVLVEGIIEYFLGNIQAVQPYLRYFSAIVGIGVCVGYRVDLLGTLGIFSVIPIVGQILTGIVISRGSNYVNDFISHIQSPQGAIAE